MITSKFATLIFLISLPTFLFPLLAVVLKCIAKIKCFNSANKAEAPSGPESIDIILPVYKDQPSAVAITVASIINSMFQVKSLLKAFNIIIVFDGTSVDVQSAVKEFVRNELRTLTWNPSIKYLYNAHNLGKWLTLYKGLLHSSSKWVSFVDAGAIWSENLSTNFLRAAASRKFVAIAPGYAPRHMSRLQRLNWCIEKILKLIENWSGGPISVHGATIFYDRTKVQKAFEALGADKGVQWFNDDVVLPLYLRIDGQIKYIADHASVGDVDHAHNATRDKQRRSRMIIGNIQWIRSLYWTTIIKNPVTAIVATRRVIRVFWAYLITLMIIFIIDAIPVLSASAKVIAVVLLFSLIIKNEMSNAFFASIRAPLLLIKKAEYTQW